MAEECLKYTLPGRILNQQSGTVTKQDGLILRKCDHLLTYPGLHTRISHYKLDIGPVKADISKLFELCQGD